MAEEQSADNDESARIEAGPGAGEAASVEQASKSLQRDPYSTPAPPAHYRSRWKQTLLTGVLAALGLAAIWAYGVPWIQLTLNTVSTDDAFVNGHVTFVAARVRGQVSRVLVDDNNRVHSGIEAQARSRRWNLQHAMEDVTNQVALLRARVAGVDKSKAALALAQVDFDRAAQLVAGNNIPRAEYDRRQAALVTARADLTQALDDVYQIRASLGLPAQPEGGDLGQVPPDLDQTFSSVLQAQADLIQSAAQLGVIHSYEEKPKPMLEAFERSDPEGNIDRTFARLAAEAPAVKQAEAKLEAANRDLAQAELDLRYCDVVADIDGVVTRRNVNPGNNVQAGEGLMAIRSLRDVWVDANFKETQLRDLRIGQAVDLYVDMYGNRAFKGRIAGFTMGTGSTLALLPAQNATGNFVKVVQRLPVRIELQDYDPDRSPLFVGTSVVPYVDIKRPPTGPDAGKFLQAYAPQSPASSSAGSAAGAER
jgi:membrane fusion protein, multidrug efflux system